MMADQAPYQDLQRLLPGQVRLLEPLKLHTTWRIGGPADVLVEPDGAESLSRALDFAGCFNLSVTVIGNGSNILVRDSGIRGMVIKIGNGFSRIRAEGDRIAAGAGVKLAQLLKVALDAGIGGFEFVAGVPGTVGGAVVMNAGIEEAAMSDVVENVVVMDGMGRLFKQPARELGFGYRTSNLQGASLIVIDAECRGTFCEARIIQARMEEILSKRKKTQPYKYPSAGSVFKNSPEGTAGYLIDQAGGKGMRVGDAMVSTVHANFIVNLGTATACDVLKLIGRVQELVSCRFGIKLALEVRVLGED